MKMYLYDYFRGMWKMKFSTNDNLHFKDCERVFRHEIELPEVITPDILMWIFKLGYQHRDSVAINIEYFSHLDKPIKVVTRDPIEIKLI